jgi:hypothetical protein
MPRVNSAFRRWNLGRLPAVAPEPIKAHVTAPISDDLPAIAKGRIKPGAIIVERECQYTGRPTEFFTEWIAVVLDEAQAYRIVHAQKYRSRATKRGMEEISNRWDGKPRKDMGVLRHLLDADGRVLCRPGLARHDDDTDAANIPDAAQFPEFMATICRGCLKRIDQDGAVK